MLEKLTLTSAIEKLRSKEISLNELYSDVDAAAQAAKNSGLNIYLTNNTSALDDAQKIDASSVLAGVPVAVKDNILTKDLRTTASSTVLDTFTPQFNATIMSKFHEAGGVVYGKTNLDAWAHGSSTETSQFGATKNPRNPEHLPGGSSGGSAAAVAADVCIAAIGTETAGSIRQPSAWCGTVGLKPTYGRVSRAGIVSMASSTDSPGPMTKTVEDAALLLNVLAGHDPYDATSSSLAVPDFTKSLTVSPKGLKVGVVYADVLPSESRAHLDVAIKELERLGMQVELVNALDPKLAISVYTVVQRGEVSSNLARYDGIRYGTDRSHFGDEAKRRIMLGTYTLSKGYADQYYTLAQKVRTLFAQDYAKLFETYDVLVSLSSPGFAKKAGATEGEFMFGELEDMLLEPSSITGLPGISVPCYRDPKTNLFLGLNIMAPMFKEETLISVAHAYEQATTWNTWRNGA